MRRKLLAVVIFGALLATAGCLNVAVDSTVNADGTIETYEADISMNNTLYQSYQMQAQQQGHSSVGAFLLANESIDTDNAENVDISETPGENMTDIHILMENYDPAPESNITVTVEDGVVTYRDLAFGSATSSEGSAGGGSGGMDMGPNMTFDYRLDMPGQITDASDGAEIDGDVATWHIEGNSEAAIYAESEISESGSSDGGAGDGGDGAGGSDGGDGAGDGSDGGDGNAGDGSDGSDGGAGDGSDGGDGGDDVFGDDGTSSGDGPGFGVVGALTAMIAAIVAAARRTDGN